MDPLVRARAQVNGLLPSVLRMMQRETFNFHRRELFANRERDPAFDSRFVAQSFIPFEIPCFLVPRRSLYIYGGGIAEWDGLGSPSIEDPEARVSLPIHPAALPQLLDAFARRDMAIVPTERRMWALPTASTRTLLVWPEGNPEAAIFVKTSLSTPLIGDRTIPQHKVARSVGLSGLVQSSLHNLPKNMGFFFESAGFGSRSMVGLGTIVRVMPEKLRHGRIDIAPVFSLFGESRDHEPLLLRIVHETCGTTRDVLEQLLCERFANIWLELSLEHGLILESHGQDLLLAVTSTMAPTGQFYYRDFEGLQVDWGLRGARRLRSDALPDAFAWYDTYVTLGYPYFQSAWRKLRSSLDQYLHLVLAEGERVAMEWQAAGRTPGNIREGDLTGAFSRHLRRAIRERYGYDEKAQYDIAYSTHQFVKFLMGVRRGVMCERQSNS